MVLHAEREAVEEKARAGLLPEGVAEAMLEGLAAEVREIRASQPAKLTVGPEELLKKVAFFTDSGGAPVGADTKATVTSAVQVLQDAGVSVEEARPTGIEEAHDLFLAVLRADAGAGVRRLLWEAGTSETHPLLQRWQELEGETPLSGPEFAELLESLDAFRSKTLAFMELYDAVFCPTWATPAAPHGTVFDEWPGVSFTHQFNLNGWPAAVVRAGTSYEGLPIGVQVAARPWREDVALVIAQRIEEALGGWKQPKGFSDPRL